MLIKLTEKNAKRFGARGTYVPSLLAILTTRPMEVPAAIGAILVKSGLAEEVNEQPKRTTKKEPLKASGHSRRDNSEKEAKE